MTTPAPYVPPPAATRIRRPKLYQRRWVQVTGGLLVALVLIGSFASDSGAAGQRVTGAKAFPAPTVTVTVTAHPTVTVTAAPRAASTATADARPAPRVTAPHPTGRPTGRATGGTATAPSAYFASCAAAQRAGAAPLSRGRAGYRPGLDRDRDGVACDG
jgi:hypothetical protein